MSVYDQQDGAEIVFYIDGKTHQPEMLHYTECGLDDIYLLNGFHREIIDDEEYITYEDLKGLWQAIGIHLVTTRKFLSPKEVRFLRRQMDLTQAELGMALRVSDQTVARWEKGQAKLEGTADVAIRFSYLTSEAAQPAGMSAAGKFRVKDLSDVEEPDFPSLKLQHSSSKWSRAA